MFSLSPQVLNTMEGNQSLIDHTVFRSEFINLAGIIGMKRSIKQVNIHHGLSGGASCLTLFLAWVESSFSSLAGVMRTAPFSFSLL